MRRRFAWTGLLLLLLAACFGSSGRAQDLRYLRQQAWSTEDGLPQDSVAAIAQTGDGFLWVATERGVARFDGTSFKTLSSASEAAFSSNDTCCLAVAGDGDLWIGTADGLLRRHGARLIRYGRSDGLPGAAIRGLVAMGDGTVLVLTAEGLVAARDGAFSPRTAAFAVEQIAAAGGGEAWLIGEPSGGDRQVARLGPGQMTPQAVEEPESAVRVGVAEGRDGAVWTASRAAVTLTKGGFFRSWKVGTALPGSRVETLFADRVGNAWVGTNDGLSLIRPDGGEPMPVAALRGNTVLTVFEDREGNYWIGTETSGLHVLRALTFRSEPALADRSITTVTQASDGAVWVGTWNDGLRRLHIGPETTGALPAASTIQGALTSPVILSLTAGANGSVWAGTPDGLNHVERDGRVQRMTAADGLPDEYVESLAGSPDGSVWVGTRHGLVHLHGAAKDGVAKDVLTRADGLGGDLIGALLLTRRGELWIATAGGLSRRSAAGQLTTLPRSAAGEIVTAVAEDARGVVWAATDKGEIGRVEANAVRPAYRPAAAARVMGLVTDARGSMWVRTQEGFERMPVADLNRCADAGLPCSLAVTPYELADGIPSEEVAEAGSPMLWRMTDGEVWGATRRGVAIVDPEELQRNATPPGVVIERLLFGDSAVAFASSPVRLPYGNARLTIEYAGLSYTVPAKVRYRVMLEGFDRTWVDVGSRRSATYTSLPPRAYRFRVQAMNDSGVWNEAGAEVKFRVVPPVYRRWWFLTLLMMLLLMLLLWIYFLRLRLLRARFEDVLKERNRIAREIHDTLAQDFVGVSLQLDLVTQYLAGSKLEAAKLQIQQTRELVTEGLKEARQSIWALRANLVSDSLPNELGKLVARYREEALVVGLTVSGPFRPLEARVEGELLRVAQEALSNVARHAGATRAAVMLRYGRDMLVLGVDDDGRGFELDAAAERDGHYGLRGLRERAGVMGGTLRIVTAPGAGTKIHLEVPIPFVEE